MEYRVERDSMGEIQVPADRLWGAQTQRSLENFPIGRGHEPMPEEIVRAFKQFGFEYTAMELGGYRTGSMNGNLGKTDKKE